MLNQEGGRIRPYTKTGGWRIDKAQCHAFLRIEETKNSEVAKVAPTELSINAKTSSYQIDIKIHWNRNPEYIVEIFTTASYVPRIRLCPRTIHVPISANFSNAEIVSTLYKSCQVKPCHYST